MSLPLCIGEKRTFNVPVRRIPRASSPADYEPKDTVAERVERVLASRGLSLVQVSQETRRRYGAVPHYLVPHNFYYDLGLPGYSPRMEQVLALSRVTNYRLAEWLSVFGFNLDRIPALQAEFPNDRTSLLDPTIYDQAAWIEWFEDVARDSKPFGTAPLGQLLTPASLRRLESLLAPEPSPFLYAKIGRNDAFAFPDLLPGSVVRADTRGVGELLQRMTSKNSERLFLVEHAEGLVCCRLHGRTKGRITLRAASLPFAQTEMRLGSEARVLGVLDWELRPLHARQPEVPAASMKFVNARPLAASGTQLSLREFLARARLRSGLSFRKASTKSRWVANALRDERNFCAPGSLANMETSSRLPGHIHKIISLCVLYSVGFWELLAVAGLNINDSGHEPIPNELVGRRIPDSSETTTNLSFRDGKRPGFLSSLIAEFQEIPLFLRHSLPLVAGIPDLSVRDVFWIGGRTDSLHPYLQQARFAAVNRRIKRPVFLKRKSQWEQSPYVLLFRDGSYLLTGCSAEGNRLVVHPFADGLSRPLALRNGIDAEVVGKVSALLRWLR
jgi:hypothetical protein